MPLLNSSYSETDATLSPNNTWLACISDESSRPELYVTPVPIGGFRRHVSTTGVDLMDWSMDGKSLRYSQGEHVYAVDVRYARTWCSNGATSAWPE